MGCDCRVIEELCDADKLSRARALAGGAAIEADDAISPGMCLVELNDALTLSNLTSPELSRGVSVNFDAAGPRLSKDQPFAKALAKRSGLVVDATAGLGGDAILMARSGWSVLMVERRPVVAALLMDGLRRAQSEAAARLSLVVGDAAGVLGRLDPAPDVVFIDPMFPPKRKASAKPRKEVRLLRGVAGNDDDAEALLRAALASGAARAVVKRADDAPPLAPGFVAQHRGKTVRYDVYR